jgi:hypothetical protein
MAFYFLALDRKWNVGLATAFGYARSPFHARSDRAASPQTKTPPPPKKNPPKKTKKQQHKRCSLLQSTITCVRADMQDALVKNIILKG